MSRRPARCTEADIKRAIKAAKAAGTNMAVKIDPDGSIWLYPSTEISVQEPEPAFDPARRIAL